MHQVGPEKKFTPDLASDHPEQFGPLKVRTPMPNTVDHANPAGKVRTPMPNTVDHANPAGETCEMRRAREYGIEEYDAVGNPLTLGFPERVTEDDPTTHNSRVVDDPEYRERCEQVKRRGNVVTGTASTTGKPINRAAKMQQQRPWLASLLSDAANAHHDYELAMKKTLGDPDWTDIFWFDWYAGYLLDHGVTQA